MGKNQLAESLHGKNSIRAAVATRGLAVAGRARQSTLLPFSAYRKFYQSAQAITRRSAEGVGADVAVEFLSKSGFTGRQFQEVFGCTVKTLGHYSEVKQVLDPTISEKLLKMLALYDAGVGVFGALPEFNRWLQVPAWGLGMQIPYSLLVTITGITLVHDEVIRIAYGDLA